jgi:hypothetical protein
MYKVVGPYLKYQIKKDYYEKFIWTKGGIGYTLFGVSAASAIVFMGSTVAGSFFMAFIPFLFVMGFIGLIAAQLNGGKWNPFPHTQGFYTDHVKPSSGIGLITVSLLDSLLKYEELKVFNDPNMVAEEVFNTLKLHDLGHVSDDELKEFNDLLRKLIVKCDEAKYRSVYENVSGRGAIQAALDVAAKVEEDLK